MSESLIDRMTAVFREVFNRSDLVLTRELTAKDVPGWDSLKHIELIVALEARFKVRFKTSEVGRLKNVGDLHDKLAAKLGATA